MSTAATYLVVADALERELAGAAPGSRVSSEHEIAARFGLHRLTARAALQELERRYRVRRVKGRGTYVARRLEYRVGPGTPASWTETVRRAGALPSTEPEAIRACRPPAEIADELGMAPGARAWLVARLRLVDGEPAGCADTYVPVAVAPDLPERLVGSASLSATLAGAYGAEPFRATYRAELELPPDGIVRRLGLEGRPWMLLTRGRTDCRHRRAPLELSTVWLRGDMFRLIVEFGG